MIILVVFNLQFYVIFKNIFWGMETNMFEIG